jgi:probable HAF family extracellular repeat protein
MRGLMCRAAVVAGAAVVLLGPAVGVASAAGGAAATATVQSQQSQNQKLPRYSLTVLGTLGGTFSQAGGGINNRGQVAGWSALPGDSNIHAVVWDRGVITDLGTLGGPNSFTPEDPALNSRGEVVGFSDTAMQDPNQEGFCGLAIGFAFGTHVCLPFIWRRGTMTALPTLGGTNGFASAINNRGQVVGVAETSHRDPACPPPQVLSVRAVLWQDGQARELPPFPGDPAAGAFAINDNGQAVGTSGTCAGVAFGFAGHALLWQDGKPIDLGNLGFPFANIAFAINNRGQIVGSAGVVQNGQPYHHAFLWQHGTMTDLGTLPGLPVSLANAINNSGQAVGFSQDADGNNTVAVLWQNGVMANLNTLIPPGSPMFLIEALGINDRGQIIGYGSLPNGQVLAYLLTPCGAGGGNPSSGCGGMAAATRATANPLSQNGTKARQATGTPMLQGPFPNRGWSSSLHDDLGRVR